MALQLKDIFAGERVGRRKVEGDTLIDQLAIETAEFAEHRPTRLRAFTGNGPGYRRDQTA
jgi:hypothetical protein